MKYVSSLFAVDTHESGERERVTATMPVGARVVAWHTRGGAALVQALCPVGAPLAAHPFYLAPEGFMFEPPIGRKVGEAWPLAFVAPNGTMILMVAAQDLPWPEPPKLIMPAERAD